MRADLLGFPYFRYALGLSFDVDRSDANNKIGVKLEVKTKTPNGVQFTVKGNQDPTKGNQPNVPLDTPRTL